LQKKISFAGRRVGVVLSGGNVDLKWAAEILKIAFLKRLTTPSTAAACVG